MPPPLTVPRLMVTLSRIVFSSPISTLVGFASVLQVLGRYADGGEGMDDVSGADAGVPVDNDMGDKRAALAQHNVWADGGKGSDGAGSRNDGTWSDDGAGMNAHSDATDEVDTDAAARGAGFRHTAVLQRAR